MRAISPMLGGFARMSRSRLTGAGSNSGPYIDAFKNDISR